MELVVWVVFEELAVWVVFGVLVVWVVFDGVGFSVLVVEWVVGFVRLLLVGMLVPLSVGVAYGVLVAPHLQL